MSNDKYQIFPEEDLEITEEDSRQFIHMDEEPEKKIISCLQNLNNLPQPKKVEEHDFVTRAWLNVETIGIDQLRKEQMQDCSRTETETQERVEILEQSFSVQGFVFEDVIPPILRWDGSTIAGRGRIEAAKKMGIKYIPVFIYKRQKGATSYGDMVAANGSNFPKLPQTIPSYKVLKSQVAKLMEDAEKNGNVWTKKETDKYLKDINANVHYNSRSLGKVHRGAEDLNTAKEKNLFLRQKGEAPTWVENKLGLKPGEYTLLNSKDETYIKRHWCDKVILPDETKPIIFWTTDITHSDAKANHNKALELFQKFWGNSCKTLLSSAGIELDSDKLAKPYKILGFVPQVSGPHDVMRASGKLITNVKDY